ncbi:ORF 3.5 [Entamoeba marina]
MWEQVRNVVKETTSNNLEKLKNGMINSLKMDNTEVELKLEELNSYITDAVRLTILERPSFVNMLMENKFISLFRNDKDGLPRKWKANDDLSKPYFHASEEAEKILDLFSYIRIDPKDDEMSFTSINPATGKKMLIEEPEDALIIPEKILFTLGERISMYDSFKHMTEVAFMRAQQEQAVTVHAKTPLWLILLILFVAFDNVLWVIQSPILLAIVLVIGGGIFALTKMGYSQEIDNILSHILKKPISPSIPLTESSDMSFDDIDNLESFDDAFQLVQSTQPTQRKQFLPKYDKSNQMTASTPTLASVAKSQSFTTYPLPSTKSPITNHEI